MEDNKEIYSEKGHNEDFIRQLNKVVVLCVKCLAILITLVIIWAVIDVAFYLYEEATLFNLGSFNIENLILIMGNFLAVLIAIEIFMNIVFYLKKDALHIHLVLGTALTAVARKVIVLDFSIISPYHIYGIAATIIAVGASFWLASKAQKDLNI